MWLSPSIRRKLGRCVATDHERNDTLRSSCLLHFVVATVGRRFDLRVCAGRLRRFRSLIMARWLFFTNTRGRGWSPGTTVVAWANARVDPATGDIVRRSDGAGAGQ